MPSAARERAKDLVLVVLVSTLPAVLDVPRSGFYLDDYNMLMLMSTSDDQSPWGYLTSLLSGDPKSHLRPVEFAVLAVLYWLFGTNPLPYHLLLATLVPVCAVMLYVVLLRLTSRREVALGVAILFATAPHYSSTRFWLVAFPPTAVLAMYLISLYCVLRALDSRGWRLAGWTGVGSAIMVASLFVYEIALPLFALTVVFIGLRALRGGRRGVVVAAVSYALALLLAIVVKLELALQVGEQTSYSIGGYQGGLLHHVAYVVAGAVKINFGSYGAGLPYVLWWIVGHRLSWAVLAISLLVGALTLLYLTRRADIFRSRGRWRGLRWPLWTELIGAGLALIAAGYGLFIVTGQIYMTSAGIDNRVNVVPALGMALLAVGVLLRMAELAPAHRQTSVFSVGVAGLAAAGVLVTGTIGGFWASAYSRQLEVLDRLEQALPRDRSHTTVLLDQLCPEIGPGIIFLGHYDLAGALRTKYRDETIDAGVMTGDVEATSAGVVISTTWVGVEERFLYRYDRRLFVYDWRRDSLTRISDRDAAREYLRETPRIACPPQRSFAWGIRTSRWIPFL